MISLTDFEGANKLLTRIDELSNVPELCDYVEGCVVEINPTILVIPYTTV